MTEPTPATPEYQPMSTRAKVIIWSVIGAIVIAVVTIVIVVHVQDAMNRARAEEHNRIVHDMIMSGINPGYSQQQLDDTCAKYPTACYPDSTAP